MKIVQQLIGAVDRAYEAEQLPRRLHSVTSQLNQDKKIDPTLRADILDLLRSVVTVAEATLNRTYPVDTIVSSVTVITSISSALLAHAVNDRATIEGWGIENSQDRSILAMVFTTEAAAAAELKSLQKLGLTATLRVVPVRVVAQTIARREVPEQPLIPEPSADPRWPVDKSIADVGAQLEALRNAQGAVNGSFVDTYTPNSTILNQPAQPSPPLSGTGGDQRTPDKAPAEPKPPTT